MKIAINTRFLLKGRLEGLGRFTWEVVRRLVEALPEEEFLFFFDRPFAPEFVFKDNIQPQVLFPPARHPLLWYWFFEHSLPQALKKWKADVFFSPDGYLSLRSQTPTAMVVHDLAFFAFPQYNPLPARLYYRHFVPRFIKRADHIVTVSEFTRKDVMDRFQIPENRISVACNAGGADFRPIPSDQQRAIREAYAGGAPYFFYVGAIHPRKNIARLIAAFDRFKDATGAQVKLLIGGRMAWQTSEVEQAFQEARHQNDIRFLGFVEDAELPRLMGAALAFVYLSAFEGFGIPLLDAMHAGVPILTSNVTSLPEVAGDAALLADPFSVESMAEGLSALYADAVLREKLVEAGQAQVQQFTWEKAAEVVRKALVALGS